ncbi:nitroreductase family protein [Mycobacterium avium]|uniref:nitroreductase family protein n=1 Tax=Mycobacterium avium TaxID=1764 RepID=UPI00215588D6|nr:nitroreductase family protein [Mycobacterium avium]
MGAPGRAAGAPAPGRHPPRCPSGAPGRACGLRGAAGGGGAGRPPRSGAAPGTPRVARRPAWVLVPGPPDERRLVTDNYDVGQATMAMMIAATDLGIGAGHSSVGDQDKARAILGVPDGHLVAFLLGVGYPADRPLTPIRKPNRRPFTEVVHRGRW